VCCDWCVQVVHRCRISELRVRILFLPFESCSVTVNLKEKCFIIQYTSDTGMFTVFVDKQNKERILEEFFFLFTHKIRTETEPKPWPKKRFTDSTVSYLYRCNPNLLPTVLQEFSVPMATVHHSCVCSAAYFHPVSLQKVLPFLFFCCSAFVCTCSLDPGLARVRWRT